MFKTAFTTFLRTRKTGVLKDLDVFTTDKGKILVPLAFRYKLYHLAHNPMHQGSSAMLNLLQQRYHWVNMDKDIKEWVGYCYVCKMYGNKGQPLKIGSLKPTGPFDIVSVDVLTFGSVAKGEYFVYNSILVTVDLFSRMVFLEPLRTYNAPNIKKALMASFKRSPTPHKLITDNAKYFKALLEVKE